jgi:alkylated DNA repair protein (DNA oxidative demethylase)
MVDLFSSSEQDILNHGSGLYQIKRFAQSEILLPIIEQLSHQSPFRHMMTPMGHPTKVAMLNCGSYGWVSNKRGYGYSHIDPETQHPWPAFPPEFIRLCNQTIDYLKLPDFKPDACLINRYDIGMSMGRHQDKDELDFNQPILSVSLGLPAVFQVYGATRQGKPQDFLLEDGDVFILSGEARRFYHGIKAIKADPLQPNFTRRYNLTFRRYQRT